MALPHSRHNVACTWTLSPLLTGSTDSHSTPGPGAYTPEQVNVNKRSAPKHSLGIRHSEYVTPLILEVPE